MNHLGQMIPINFIIQILGLGGLVIAAYAFQSNNYKHIIMFKLCSEFLFALQYFLLGAYTGMAMDLLSSVRNLIYKRKADQNQSAFRYIFIFSFVAITAGIATWSSIYSIIPIICKLFSTTAYGIKDPRKVRLLTLPSCLGWLLYNLLYHSAAGAVSEILTLFSILVAIKRFDMA